MPPDVEPSAWEFLSLVAAWNVYGLPALLVLFVLGWLIRGRMHRPEGRQKGMPDESRLEMSRSRFAAIRTFALLHLGLAIRAGIGLAQELLTLRVQGIPQSFPVTGILIPSIAVPANLAIGHGLWWLRPWGRKVAIGWNSLVAIVTASVAAWQWKHRAVVRLDQWPDYLVADGLPWILLAIMLLPGTRLMFAAPREKIASDTWAFRDAGRGSRSLIFLLALLLLLVVISTTLVDVVDWVVRSLSDDDALG
jgi:hypothetical protein